MNNNRIQLLDVDGVLADFATHVIRTSGIDFDLANYTEWDIFTLLGPEGAEAKRALKDPDWWLSIPPIEGAQDAVEDYKMVADVVCVTAPWISCKGWGWARRKWLEKHFEIPHRDVIITSQKELVEGDEFIDDKPETVSAWLQRHPLNDAWLFDAPYNQDELLIGKFKRIYGWPQKKPAGED